MVLGIWGSKCWGARSWGLSPARLVLAPGWPRVPLAAGRVRSPQGCEPQLALQQRHRLERMWLALYSLRRANEGHRRGSRQWNPGSGGGAGPYTLPFLRRNSM